MPVENFEALENIPEIRDIQRTSDSGQQQLYETSGVPKPSQLNKEIEETTPDESDYTAIRDNQVPIYMYSNETEYHFSQRDIELEQQSSNLASMDSCSRYLCDEDTVYSNVAQLRE